MQLLKKLRALLMIFAEYVDDFFSLIKAVK